MIIYNVMRNHEYFLFYENESSGVEKIGPLTKRLKLRLLGRKVLYSLSILL